MSARILVVEDDQCMRDLLRLHLRLAGYQVQVAEDALIAGRMVLQSPPNLMVVDVEMPYMNGIEFVATLVADQTLPHIPAIFLTARPNFEERAAELGAGYIRKPCQVAELLKAVEQRLARAPDTAANMSPLDAGQAGAGSSLPRARAASVRQRTTSTTLVASAISP